MNLFNKNRKNNHKFSAEDYYEKMQKELDDKQTKLDKIFNTHEEELDAMFDKTFNHKEQEDWFDKLVEEERKKQR